jgi:hypothetical protein
VSTDCPIAVHCIHFVKHILLIALSNASKRCSLWGLNWLPLRQSSDWSPAPFLDFPPLGPFLSTFPCPGRILCTFLPGPSCIPFLAQGAFPLSSLLPTYPAGSCHRLITKFDHGHQEGLDIKTGVTDRQILSFYPDVCVYEVLVILTIDIISL